MRVYEELSLLDNLTVAMQQTSPAAGSTRCCAPAASAPPIAPPTPGATS
ncbi:MAG: hypothetical protein WDO24_23995 [Pseudomonadota bacterium]